MDTPVLLSSLGYSWGREPMPGTKVVAFRCDTEVIEVRVGDPL